MAQLNRRHVLGLGLGLGAVAAGFETSFAAGPETGQELHGLSAFGELKYPAGFPNFDYVTPDAPKGGVFSQIVGSGGSTFDSFNAYILKGEPANGMDLTFASLMVRAFDEADAVYLQAADRVKVSDDGTRYRFHLRDGISFHDGTPISSADVVFSLKAIKEKGHPSLASILSVLETVEAEDDRTVVLRFAPTRGLDVPPMVAAMPILSAKYYESRKFEETSLEAPLGSGPYRLSRFEQGHFVEFTRVKDWWGKDLPVSRGINNFDLVRDEYYRDREAGIEAFSGRNYLFREEFTSRAWATRYDFPAIREGRVKKQVIPDERASGAQGWLLNTRREKFKDRRVREALAMAFDFEWTNKNYMYGSYERTHSVFQNSDMMAKGEPSPEEIRLLEPFRDRVLPEVFGPAWVPPVSDGSGQDRRLLRAAGELLNNAGWTVKDRRRVNANGEQFTMEFLLTERTFEQHHAAFIRNLGILGIDAKMRFVDPTQATERTKSFDFDVVVDRFIFPQIPGTALKFYFSSELANTNGSKNLAGIADPVVDTLIAKAIAATSKAQLVTACRALDRVLRVGQYWIPHWNKASFWIAYWDQFGHPATKPRYARGIPETWWSDPNKAANAGQAK
jgi:microcin C transport system substrate-binding protein